jgi:hypothetical protein
VDFQQDHAPELPYHYVVASARQFRHHGLQQPGSRKQPAMTGLGDQRQDGGDGGGTGSVRMECGGPVNE